MAVRGTRCRATAFTCAVLLAMFCVSAHGHNLHMLLKDTADCQPWTVPRQEQCEYVMANAKACFPEGGVFLYIRWHYCSLGQWQWVSGVLLVVAVTLLLMLLVTASERFFCPSLELIADYLKLPPAVAGATLLSFGNGAPDLFTQLAAVSQGDESALALALSEPLGGGLFVSNVVMACVVLACRKTWPVLVQQRTFLKDLMFYLAAVCMVFLCLLDGKVVMWQCLAMGALYLVYVAVTIRLGQGQEPVHASPALREVPRDCSSEDSSSCSYSDSEDDVALGGPSRRASPARSPARVSPSRLTHVQQWAGNELVELLLQQPLLEVPDLVGRQQGQEQQLDLEQQGVQQALPDQGQEAAEVGAAGCQRPELPAKATAGSCGVEAGLLPPPLLQQQQNKQEPHQEDKEDQAGVQVPAPQPLSPSQHDSYWGGQLASWGSSASLAAMAELASIAATSSRGASPTAQLQQEALQQLHQAFAPRPASALQPVASGLSGDGKVVELQEPLLGLATGAQPSPGQSSWHHHHRRIRTPKQKLQLPFLFLLSLTMPRVSSRRSFYPRAHALLLPFTLPMLLLSTTASLAASWVPSLALCFLPTCVLAASVTCCFYPRHGQYGPRVKGAFIIVTFITSILWLNTAANMLVNVALIVGRILGVEPALLGATVLAWGNSLPDLTNNLAMARDGFPTMALAACFASPLFQMLAGMALGLGLGTISEGGVLEFEIDKPLEVMYVFTIFNLVKYLLLVPLVFKCRLGMPIVFIALGFYAIYQVAYLLAVMGNLGD